MPGGWTMSMAWMRMPGQSWPGAASMFLCEAVASPAQTRLGGLTALVSLGSHCAQCCAGLFAILLVVGVMNLLAMSVVAAAITVERVLPDGERVARVIGAVVIATGALLIAQAVQALG